MIQLKRISKRATRARDTDKQVSSQKRCPEWRQIRWMDSTSRIQLVNTTERGASYRSL